MAAEARKANLFLDLELDPDASWNQADFERRLKEKQREWSKDTMNPTEKGRASQRKLENLPAFKRTAADPALREAEAAKAREIRKEAQAAGVEEIDRQLGLLEPKGFLLEEELQALVKQFAPAFSLADIRKRVKVEIRAGQRPGSPKPSTVKPLEPAVANRVRQNLAAIGQPDLYQFLGLGPTSGCQQLRDRAEQEHLAMMRKANKGAEVTARQELAGLCLTLLGSPDQRERYDETLRLDRIRQLTDAVDVAAGVTKQLVQGQIDVLLRYGAEECGIMPKDGQEAILEHARTKGYQVVLAQAAGGPPPMRRCGECGRLNDEKKNNCTGCGAALQAPCPKCGKPVWSDEQNCGACGFPAGNRSFVRVMLGEIDAAMAGQDYDLANMMLGQVRKAWPAPPADALAVETEKRGKLIAPVVARIEESERKLDEAMKARRYCQARDLLDGLAKLRPEPESAASRRTSIVDAIRAAEAQVSKARSLAAAQPDTAIVALQEALRLCADHDEALALLARLPPSPARGLTAVSRGQIVQLSWQPSGSPGVGYVVVRKAKARPASANDGTRLARVSGAAFDDEQPEVGVPLHYAVYADRGGVLSAEAALLQRPAMVLADVTTLTATVTSGTVELAWQAPEHAYDVRIVRSDVRTPRAEGDGQLVLATSTGKAVDRGLINGRTYYYAVWARFRDDDGTLRVSPGVSAEATPGEPPKPVELLKISEATAGSGRALVLEFERPAKGEVAILHTRQPAGLAAGEVLSARDFQRYGETLSATGRQAWVPVEGPGVHYFTPAVIHQQMVYVGAEKRYVYAEDVTDLKTQNMGFAIRTQWRWPVGCKEVVVAWSTAGWPQPEAPGAATRPLTRAQYDLNGCCDVPSPGDKDLYLTVFAVTQSGGERFLSGGQSQGARKLVALGSRITLDYTIKKALLRAALSLEIGKQGTRTWPALLLVRKQGSLPMSAEDGEVILRIEASSSNEARQTISLPREAARSQAYAKLFLEDSSLYDCVVIRDPDRSSMKLF